MVFRKYVKTLSDWSIHHKKNFQEFYLIDAITQKNDLLTKTILKDHPEVPEPLDFTDFTSISISDDISIVQ